MVREAAQAGAAVVVAPLQIPLEDLRSRSVIYVYIYIYIHIERERCIHIYIYIWVYGFMGLWV